jgi:hypothetical protein
VAAARPTGVWQAAEKRPKATKECAPIADPSFPRKRESSIINDFWIPARRFAPAGMTVFGVGKTFLATC